jgi:transcription antitermination protein NusB
MASRREIREAAVQFLYCADIEDSSEKEVHYQNFWSIVLESDEKKLRKASAKALLHLNQGRSSRYAKLVDRSPEALALIKANSQASKLSELLQKILEKENELQPMCDRLSRLLHSDLESAMEELEDTIDLIFTSNHVLRSYRKDWFNLLEDFPSLGKKIEVVSAQITALEQISKRVHMVEEPECYPEQTDVSHLRESIIKITEYRESVDAFVTGVLKHKDSIDASISKVVKNYHPSRISPVDKAVIRLATFEILYSKDVPAPVAINEAIEIVKKFGSNESASFANGILDAISKNIENS